MNKSDFFYDLPEELIAQHPLEPRDHSRMMVLSKDSDNIEHKHLFCRKNNQILTFPQLNRTNHPLTLGMSWKVYVLLICQCYINSFHT